MKPHHQRQAAEKGHALAEASYVELAKLQRAGGGTDEMSERTGLDGMADDTFQRDIASNGFRIVLHGMMSDAAFAYDWLSDDARWRVVRAAALAAETAIVVEMIRAKHPDVGELLERERQAP